MLNLRPSVTSLKAQIEALRTQILTLSDDPEAIAELDRRLAAVQEAASAVPSAQRDIANLQAAIEQAVRQEQMDKMATTDMVADVRSMVEAIKLPDLTPYVTTTELNEVAVQVSEMNGESIERSAAAIKALIPNVTNLASKASVEQVNARIPDVSGLASKDALAAVNAKIPDISSLATSASVSALAARIPDTSSLATKDSVAQLAARIPDTSSLASTASVTSLADTVSKIVVPVPATSAPPATDLVQQIGTSTKFAREDHTHKARIKRASVVIGANGYATWTFNEPFATPPIISHMVQEQAGLNRVNVIVTDVTTTSVTVYADRLKNLPVVQPVTGLLADVVGGVNRLVTALSGLNLGGGSAQGVKVHLMAAEATPN